MDLKEKPFAVVAIIGQELLAAGEIQPAITVLEATLQIGSISSSLRGSVYSALSSAYWKLGNAKRAIHYMLQDLHVVESTKDEAGMCRVHGNLGNSYYSQCQYTEALQHHRLQLSIAAKLKDDASAAQALTSLGHVYVSVGDYDNALASHKRCALLQQQLNNKIAEARELGNVGTVYAIMGDFENATHCQEEHLRIARELVDNREICRALSNLGSLYQNTHRYDLAIRSLQEVVKIALHLREPRIECRALSGLGHSFRSQDNTKAAEECHTRQLQLAIDMRDKTMECRAQSNLGITFQQKGDFLTALEYHKIHLAGCRKLEDKDGEGRAYGNMGNAYHSLGQYRHAVKYHKLGLGVTKELKDKHSQATLHGNLAVAYQALNMKNEAVQHYQQHLSLAKELRNLRLEALAESNLGNFYGASEDFQSAVEHYENYLSIAQKLEDKSEMCKAFHSLAYSYYQLESYADSIEYYEKNISIANELNDRKSLSLSYCNLGLAYLALNDHDKAIRCQKLFLASARESKNIFNICKALGNLGEVYVSMGDFDEGLQYLNEQIHTAEDSDDKSLCADCYNAAGIVYEKVSKYEDALNRFNQELQLRREINDTKKLCKCLEKIGKLHETLKDYSVAYNFYDEIFQIGKRNKSSSTCIHACRLMGKVNMNLKKYDKAITSFRLQLECLDETVTESIEAGRIHANIGQCFIHLNDFDNAIEHLTRYQSIATSLRCYEDENKAYFCLGDLHRKNDNLTEALVNFEKRLLIVQDLDSNAKCDAYRDLGELHVVLGNCEQGISCYEQLLSIATQAKIVLSEIEAYSGLGNIYRSQKIYDQALRCHVSEKNRASETSNLEREATACISVGDVYELLAKYDEALRYFETSLQLAEQNSFSSISFSACGRLGKLHHLLNNTTTSTSYLQLASSIAETIGKDDVRIIACYRLGVVYYNAKLHEPAKKSFEQVLHIVETSQSLHSTKKDKSTLSYALAAYQMLQRVLVAKKRDLEALYIAEKANCLHLELLLQQSGIKVQVRVPTFDRFKLRLQKIQNSICFYSLVTGYVYGWLLLPKKGLVKFWKHPITIGYSDTDLMCLDVDDTALQCPIDCAESLKEFVDAFRVGLGVQKHVSGLLYRKNSFEITTVETTDNKTNKTSRVGSPVVMSNTSSPSYKFRYKRKSTEEKQVRIERDDNWQQKAPFEELYKILIAPIDYYYEQHYPDVTIDCSDLCLVTPGDLNLVPISVLKGEKYETFVGERYKLSFGPSLFWLLDLKNDKNRGTQDETSQKSIVIGTIDQKCNNQTPSVADILNTEPIVGSETMKEDIITSLRESSVCHLATETDWQQTSFVFPCSDIANMMSPHSNSPDPEIEHLDKEERVTSPVLADVFLSAQDISELKLSTKLISFGIPPEETYSDPICTEGLSIMITTILMAGVKAVLTSLWPVNNRARSIFLNKFYELFQHGLPVRDALHEATKTLKSVEGFEHPSYWGGFVVYGQNAKIQRKVENFTNTLHMLLEKPSREAIKVILHLVSTLLLLLT